MSYIYRYAAKIVCGASDGKVVAPGEYWTAVNVRNTSAKGVAVQKKFFVAFPGEKCGPKTKTFEAKLDGELAFEIDRDDIFAHTKDVGVTNWIKGFVLLQCEVELDVVAVYTVLGKGGSVSIHTERVPPRRILKPTAKSK